MISRYCLILVLATAASAEAQEPWLDTVPPLSAVCVREVGELENLALPDKVRRLASTAGYAELGIPFVLQKSPVEGKPGLSTWEMCAVRPAAGKSTAGLEARTLPSSPGAFQICAGTDTKACAESLKRWITGKLTEFQNPIRVIPLTAFAESKREAIRATISQVVVSTPDKLTVLASDKLTSATKHVPEPIDSLDRQLFGNDKTPRPLLTTPSIMGSEGPAFNGILIYVALTESQEATLKSTK